ncbi:DUF1565 domain-containing protein [Dokdonella sp.]|uniref:DUF1565 domain-containing protein n=1 Tax=Dokdonella sp. TaxID=2291710 RepID=UPI0025C68789|nr:DUF1565 domain-containing protein [Dokdonella sp.]MBX3691778.1 DUF1565 domain-containing protein [Dokdonella sp.]MCW5566685.1 DUF1565 domain-containing protein [Dokdonella sp.]
MSARRVIAGLAPAIAALPLAVSAYFGKGPDGHDNGQAHACTGTSATLAAVLCVRAGAAPGGNGSTAAPYAGINAAIAAAKAGDIVQVAAGTYAENVALGSLNNGSGKHLTLLGGFNADFSVRDAGSHVSIIDGGLANPAVQLHLDSGQTSVLDGFTITRGRGLGNDWSNGYGHGGGVYATLHGNGGIVISHNLIHGNFSNQHTSADTRGGGIHTYTQSWGSATGTIRIEHNTVRENQAGKGAGINVTGRQAELRRNLVENNIGHHDHGGGIYVSASTVLADNIVRGNVTGATQGYGWGGGVLVAAADAQMQGNVITGNYAPTTGAGVFWDEGATGTMRNDLIHRNLCPNGGRSGAAIYIDGGPGGPSMIAIDNVTVADHLCPDTAPDGAAVVIEDGSQASFRNAIFHGNSREFSTLSGGGFSITWSITQVPGNGNFSADPLFADASTGDYHLRSTAGRFTPGGWVTDAVDSPGIDAGDPMSDHAWETAPNGGRINLGAYGNTPQASRSPGSDRIFADGFEVVMR